MTGDKGPTDLAVHIFSRDPIEIGSYTFNEDAYMHDEISINMTGVLCTKWYGPMARGVMYVLRCDSTTMGRYVLLRQPVGDMILCDVQILSESLCEFLSSPSCFHYASHPHV